MFRRSAARPWRTLTQGAGSTAALVLLAATAACGSPQPAEESGEAGWSFTDAAGETVELPERPERVVAYSGVAAALWDYGFEVVGAFGPAEDLAGENAPQAGDIDRSEVEWLSTSYGEMSIEALSALEPDLIVTQAFGDLAWYLPEDELDQIEALAPIATIQLNGVSADEALQSHLDLAVALGVDEDGPEVTAAREAYEESLGTLDEATAGNPDLQVLPVAAGPESLFVGNAAAGTDLELFREHGVNLPDTDAPDADQFEQLSWEEADKYPADLILQDARPQATPVEDLSDLPIWSDLPAVQADQVGAWHAETPYSHTQFAATVNELAETVSSAEVID